MTYQEKWWSLDIYIETIEEVKKENILLNNINVSKKSWVNKLNSLDDLDN